MILTVTLNAAIDVTYRVERLVPHSSNRVHDVHQRAGGKGINVARVLHHLGYDVAVTGLAGGRTGEQIRDDLATSGLRDELIAVTGDSRRTVAVVDETDATVLSEPGAAVTLDEWIHFVARFRKQVAKSRVAVLAGSLPPGMPEGAYAVLGEAAHAAGVPVLLDSSGPPLLVGLAGHPDVVKPNGPELAEFALTSDVLAAAEALQLRGAGAVVVSLGAEGAVAVTGAGRWRACPPAPVRGNPTGAGDALVAALAAGIADGRSWPERLVDAVALSAATVLSPVAGSFDPDAYRDFRRAIWIEEL